MWTRKGIIVSPETDVYCFLRGEKKARRRQGEKATLSSVLLEYVRQGMRKGKTRPIIHAVCQEEGLTTYAETSTDVCQSTNGQSNESNEERYDILDWLDGLEKQAANEPEQQPIIAMTVPIEATICETEECGPESVNVSPDISETRPIIPKIPIGNRMSGCTTIWHKQAAFQIETTTQQQRLVWLIRDCGFPLDEFLSRTGINKDELLRVFLENIDKVNGDIMRRVCNGFTGYSFEWLKEGGDFRPYIEQETSETSPAQCQNTSKPGNQPEVFSPPATSYADELADDKDKERKNLIGGLVEGLLIDKQRDAGLQEVLNDKGIIPKTDKDGKVIGIQHSKTSQGQEPMLMQKGENAVEQVIQKYNPKLRRLMRATEPEMQDFIIELGDALAIQYPEIAQSLERMRHRVAHVPKEKEVDTSNKISLTRKRIQSKRRHKNKSVN